MDRAPGRRAPQRAPGARAPRAALRPERPGEPRGGHHLLRVLHPRSRDPGRESGRRGLHGEPELPARHLRESDDRRRALLQRAGANQRRALVRGRLSHLRAPAPGRARSDAARGVARSARVRAAGGDLLFALDRGGRHRSSSRSPPPPPQNEPGTSVTGHPAFTFTADGALHVFWERFNGATAALNLDYSVSTDAGDSFSDPCSLGGGTGVFQWLPSALAWPDHGLVVGWHDDRKGDADIYVASVGLTTAVATPATAPSAARLW